MISMRGPVRLLLVSGVVWACTVQPTIVARAPEPREPSEVTPVEPGPPPPGEAPHVAFPSIQHRTLANGLRLSVVERHQHPLIELRLVVRSGSAADADKPGLALLAAEMMKAGGAGRFEPLELLEEADALGADLRIRTGPDATVIALGVTSPLLDGALELLSAVALHPRFRPREFELLRNRETERLASAARGDAEWAGAMVLYRELYSLPSGVHPYSRYDTLPSQLSRITLADCRAWHRAQVVPSNTTLVLVGDVTPDAALAAATRWFESFSGPPAPQPRIEPPVAQTERHIYLVDRPGSAQAQILVGLLGPPRQSDEWPALTVADQILGGGVSGRLFLDVRERRSLAYATGSAITSFAVGPSALVLSAGTMTAKADEAVGALLEQLAIVSQRPPSPEELQAAQTFLSDGFVLELETVGSVAELTARLEVLGLPDDDYDTYRARVRELTASEVATTAGEHYDKVPVIVVAGDAGAIRPSLAAFGPVTLVDPERAFAADAPREPAAGTGAPPERADAAPATTDSAAAHEPRPGLCDLPDTAVEAPLFASNDTNLRERGTRILDDVVACVKAGLLGGRALLVVGYADPRGGALHNEAISLERARAVQRYLIRRGVSPARIQIASRGERQALGEAPESWMYDRRVEIHLLPASDRGR